MSGEKKGAVLFGKEMTLAYQAHITAVGQVAYYWNDLHEVLGELFAQVLGAPHAAAMAVWYSTQNDRAQREMLLAAIRANAKEASLSDRWKSRPKALQDIKWLADYVTGTLSDHRNDALHAPFELHMFLGKPLEEAFRVGPNYFLGNPRAEKLKGLHGADLIDEFDRYAVITKKLGVFGRAMREALTDAGSPWPEKPQLPTRGQRLSRG